MNKIILNSFLIIIFSYVVIDVSVAQKKVIKNEDFRIRLIHKKKHLKAFYCINLEEPIYKRYWNRQKYKVSCEKGKFRVIGQNLQYSYNYDSLYRVYEASMYTEWSNHSRNEYMLRKFRESETEPYKCFFYSKLNYPYEMEINYECSSEITWTDVIQYEIENRRKYYERGFSSTNTYEFVESDAINEFYKFLFD
jgi:hypothetical protein